MQYIQSSKNQFLKAARQLKQKKFREKWGLFLLEGIRSVEEALESAYPLEYVFLVEELIQDLGERLSECCPTYCVSPELLSTVTETEHPQGVVAVALQRKLSLRELEQEGTGELLIIVDGVQDPGNLGTIIRTAQAAGTGGIILTKATVDIYNSKTVRASMGSILTALAVPDQSPGETVDWLRDKGYKMIVGHLGAKRFYYEVDYSGKVAVVVGNENSGPSSEFIDAGCPVKIPCRTESLNVAIASAILLYEKVRQTRVSRDC